MLAILFAFIGVIVALPNQNSQVPQLRGVVETPRNCYKGQLWTDGRCQEVWNQKSNPNPADLMALVQRDYPIMNRKLTKVPDLKCPPGYRRDALGVCRRMLP